MWSMLMLFLTFQQKDEVPKKAFVLNTLHTCLPFDMHINCFLKKKKEPWTHKNTQHSNQVQRHFVSLIFHLMQQQMAKMSG